MKTALLTVSSFQPAVMVVRTATVSEGGALSGRSQHTGAHFGDNAGRGFSQVERIFSKGERVMKGKGENVSVGPSSGNLDSQE